MRTNRVSFSSKVPLVSKYYEFNKDSIQFLFQITPNNKNVVIPLLIFKGNKRKAKLGFALLGKGISAREYAITYKNLIVKNDTTVLGKSKDPALFKEQTRNVIGDGIISPLYGTGYILRMKQAKKANITVHFEFEVKNKAGLTEDFVYDLPLKKTIVKKYTLFNPFK